MLFTGAEASGKTSLSNELKNYGVVVGEYVREFIDTYKRDTVYADVDLIAKEQLRRENEARNSGEKLAIFDTNLISNMLYSKLLFGVVPEWIEPELIRSNYDLIILLDPIGIEWQSDGQRCLDTLEKRVDFYNQIRSWLDNHNKPYVKVGGSYEKRLQQTLDLMQPLLATQTYS